MVSLLTKQKELWKTKNKHSLNFGRSRSAYTKNNLYDRLIYIAYYIIKGDKNMATVKEIAKNKFEIRARFKIPTIH